MSFATRWQTFPTIHKSRCPRRARQLLAGGKLMRNGFSVHFTSYEPLMAKCPAVSSVAQLCAMAGRLCRTANCLSTHQLPTGSSFLAWFPENEPALRGNSASRHRNAIIAIKLLPVFESEPWAWEAVTFLNRGSLNVNASLAQYLSGWRSECPPELRPFVSRLAEVFGVKL